MAVEQPDLARTPGAGSGARFNVYAAMPGVTPDVVLSTHMDTVPPFFGCTEDDEFLYGRGTCDAKGIIAAQVAAADRLRDAGVKVGLLFVVGEERDSAGAKVANLHPRGSRFLINGEPTDNRLALATKGALRVELRAQGTHGALRLPGAGRVGDRQTRRGAARCAGHAAADRTGDRADNAEHWPHLRRLRAQRHRRQG